MRVKISRSGITYDINWEHGIEPGKKKPRRTTTCIIQEVYDDRRQHEETVVCSRQDNFTKETGRKLSLARTLAKINRWTSLKLSKPDRAEVWKAYFERKETPHD